MPYVTSTVTQFHNTGSGANKGFLQKLLDYCCGDKYEENLGTGDGTPKAFSKTLSNTPMAKGNILLKFRVDSVWYEIWDDGTSWDYHDLVSSSSINYSTGAVTATITADNGEDVDVVYCVGQNSGEEGRDWLIVTQQNTKDNGGSDAFPGEELQEVVIKNSGYSYKETIFVALRETKYVPGSFYNLNINVYDTYDDSLGFNQNSARTGKSSYDATYENWTIHPAIALNDTTFPYWFYCSKARIIAEARPTTGVYTSMYVGAGLRLCAPSDYRHPYCAIGSINHNNGYSYAGDAHSFIAGQPAGAYQAMVIDPNDDYQTNYSNVRYLPKQYFTSSYTFGKTTDGKVLRFPVVLWDYGTDWTLFQLEEVYYCPCNAINSEDTLTDGGDTYDVFQNVFRTAYTDYMCVKQE